MSENPMATELPSLLTRVLLEIEGLRRTGAPTAEEWRGAHEELERFASLQGNLVPRTLAGEVEASIAAARGALTRQDAEGAREALLGIGRALDAWVRSQRDL